MKIKVEEEAEPASRCVDRPRKQNLNLRQDRSLSHFQHDSLRPSEIDHPRIHGQGCALSPGARKAIGDGSASMKSLPAIALVETEPGVLEAEHVSPGCGIEIRHLFVGVFEDPGPLRLVLERALSQALAGHVPVDVLTDSEDTLEALVHAGWGADPHLVPSTRLWIRLQRAHGNVWVLYAEMSPHDWSEAADLVQETFRSLEIHRPASRSARRDSIKIRRYLETSSDPRHLALGLLLVDVPSWAAAIDILGRVRTTIAEASDIPIDRSWLATNLDALDALPVAISLRESEICGRGVNERWPCIISGAGVPLRGGAEFHLTPGIPEKASEWILGIVKHIDTITRNHHKD